MIPLQLAAQDNLAILILACIAVLGYVSLEYKYLYNGLPIFLLGVSMVGIVFWQLGIFSGDMMFGLFGFHAIGIGVIVVLDEVT